MSNMKDGFGLTTNLNEDLSVVEEKLKLRHAFLNEDLLGVVDLMKKGHRPDVDNNSGSNLLRMLPISGENFHHGLLQALVVLGYDCSKFADKIRKSATENSSLRKNFQSFMLLDYQKNVYANSRTLSEAMQNNDVELVQKCGNELLDQYETLAKTADIELKNRELYPDQESLAYKVQFSCCDLYQKLAANLRTKLLDYEQEESIDQEESSDRKKELFNPNDFF